MIKRRTINVDESVYTELDSLLELARNRLNDRRLQRPALIEKMIKVYREHLDD